MTVKDQMLDVDNRRGHVVNDLIDMRDEEVAEVTIIDGQEFDHREWLEAEMIELSQELEQYRKLATV